MENLKQVVRSWYPCLHSQTYCVPPVYMNRVPYSRQSIAGQSVLVLPKPEDLGQQYRRGDFDVLIIHRQYGVLIGEIKAVGLNAADLKKTQAESDADVAKRVKRRSDSWTGPPGTGKSVVLVIMALVWLRDGHDVHVLSLRPGSLAMALLMCHQLRMTLKSDRGSFVKAGRVRFHYFDLVNQLEDVEKVLETLVSASQESEELHVIMDEAEFAFQPDRKAHYLVTQLFLRVLRLSLWAAQVGTSYIPAELQVEQVTVPLRCAPTVLREVAPAKSTIMRQMGKVQFVTPTNCTLPPNHKNTTKTPALRYRDVIVVTRSSDLHDEVKDDRGQVTSQASGFVLGLRASGIPVAVVTFLKGGQDVEDWKRVVTDVALAESDVVTVADCGVVLGLERKLVVCLPGRRMGYDDKRSDRQVRQRERLTAMSRCSTQLVVISLPGDGDDDEVDDAEDHGGDDGDDDDDNGGDDNDDDDDEDNDNGDDDSDPVNPRQS
nr:hypothetical protein BaRGS_020695 [Batillaria attramentaria]